MTIISLGLGMLLSYVSIRSYRAIQRHIQVTELGVFIHFRQYHLIVCSHEGYDNLHNSYVLAAKTAKLQDENKKYREALRSIRSAVAIKVK